MPIRRHPLNFIRSALGHAEKIWAAIYRRRSSALDSMVASTSAQAPVLVVTVLGAWLQYQAR
ncbi:hypothetical protein ACIA8F_38670 [Streptomyces sp. NPDC051563]|uniref:hypothetical protein n=1 Tax=Streptomyces sp. NPDC051563 TaxID=3365659 RepID=UPI0037A5B8CD